MVAAYRQNERLRIVLIDALLKLESKLKTLLTEEMIQRTQDVYWCYDNVFTDLNLLDTALKKSREEIITRSSQPDCFLTTTRTISAFPLG
jgi:hypothetical protein